MEKQNYKPEEYLYVSARRCGNTTRIADYCIQKLFIDGEVTVVDHWGGSGNNSEHLRLARIIRSRLRNEHPNVNFSDKLNGGVVTFKVEKNEF